jgi:putative intracellular protease/amidase
MRIVIFVFDGITILDAVGPYEVLQRLPDAETILVGARTGLVRTDTKSLAVNADASIAEITSADVLVMPGGFGTDDLIKQPEILDWVRKIHESSTWTTSVCTGSLVLGAAGLLRGLKATTHWAWMERLREFGAEPISQRVVEQGKIVTAAGVASGIDMALTLARRIAGDTFAHAIQIGIEYDPQPPFDGCAARAPAEVISQILAMTQDRRERRADSTAAQR